MHCYEALRNNEPNPKLLTFCAMFTVYCGTIMLQCTFNSYSMSLSFESYCCSPSVKLITMAFWNVTCFLRGGGGNYSSHLIIIEVSWSLVTVFASTYSCRLEATFSMCDPVYLRIFLIAFKSDKIFSETNGPFRVSFRMFRPNVKAFWGDNHLTVGRCGGQIICSQDPS